MQNPPNNVNPFLYDMNNKSRGCFYINIEMDYTQEFKEKLSKWKSEITRLGFSKKKTLKHQSISNYIKGEINEGSKFSNDDCVALLNCVPKEKVLNELDILKQFHLRSGHELHGKPRMLFMIYQVEEEKKDKSPKIQTDGEMVMMLPIEADMLIVRVETTDMSSTIENFYNALQIIDNETDIEDFLITFVNLMKPDIVTTYNTLTKRLMIAPKAINEKMQEEIQKNDNFARLLKQFLEKDDENDCAQKLKEKYNIEELLDKISKEPCCKIPNRADIVRELNSFIW